MSKKILNPLNIKNELVNDLKKQFGDNLLSVVIHGSAATARYAPGKSDINIISVVRDCSIPSLRGAHKLEKKWEKRKVRFSFFLTPEYIENSLDVYPLEFFEIKNANILLYGKDYFKNLLINRSYLRLQCEREFKGKILHLKREFIRRQEKKKALKELLKLSFSQFLILFRGVLYASGAEKIPAGAEDLCREVGERLNVNMEALKIIARNEIKEHKDVIEQIFVLYVLAIERIINAVNRLRI